jgi:cytochrome c556
VTTRLDRFGAIDPCDQLGANLVAELAHASPFQRQVTTGGITMRLRRPRVSAAILAIVCSHAPLSSGEEGTADDIAHELQNPAPAGGDLLDPRKPLPLLPQMAAHQKANMRQHLEAVQGIVAALALGDFDAVERHARTMGYTEQTAQMCRHMAAEDGGDFLDRALAFHHGADEIAVAARTHDATKVLHALDQTLSRCTGCHATYRQQIVEVGSR